MWLSQVENPSETKQSETWPEHKLDTVEKTRVQYIPKYNSLISSDS